MTRIYLWFLALAAACASLWTWLRSAEARGRKKAEEQQSEQVQNDLHLASEANRNINQLPDDDVSERLRDEWTRS